MSVRACCLLGERRSAVENKRVALFRLRLVLATEHREGVDDGDLRTEMWRSRCRKGRVACNPEHHDYPAMLALALDVLFASELDPKKASARLECTPSQLLKLIKDHAPAWETFNRARIERGLHGLH